MPVEQRASECSFDPANGFVRVRSALEKPRGGIWDWGASISTEDEVEETGMGEEEGEGGCRKSGVGVCCLHRSYLGLTRATTLLVGAKSIGEISFVPCARVLCWMESSGRLGRKKGVFVGVDGGG